MASLQYRYQNYLPLLTVLLLLLTCPCQSFTNPSITHHYSNNRLSTTLLYQKVSSSSSSERRFFLQTTAAALASSSLSLNLLIPPLLLTTTTTLSSPKNANAAPPMAVIAEELGYFPVTNRNGDTVYVPSKVKRKSTDQAFELGKYLQSKGAVMYGAYWCPHCSHQKEILGREAFALIHYTECASKGFQSNAAMCLQQKVDGFPTWKIGNKVRSGEMPLVELAKWSGYRGKIEEELEGDVSMSGMSGSCR